MTKELIEMIGKITGNDEIAAMAERKNGGDDMLCTAFENYRRDAEDEGRKEGKIEGKIELIRKFMKNFNKSADEAMDILGIDETEKEELKKKCKNSNVIKKNNYKSYIKDIVYLM